MKNKHFDFIGWLLFIVSAIAFITSSLKSGDLPSLIGGVFFLVACLVFLVPFFRPESKNDPEND